MRPAGRIKLRSPDDRLMASTGCLGSGRSFFEPTAMYPIAGGTMQAFLLVSLGGVLGANARYWISTWAAGRFGIEFPYGTLLVNVAGSFLLGLVSGLLDARFIDDPNARLAIATGFLGAETTFSTFAYETVALLRFSDFRDAIRNIMANVVLGIAAAAAGLAIAAAATGTTW
jgi:CrcB protein